MKTRTNHGAIVELPEKQKLPFVVIYCKKQTDAIHYMMKPRSSSVRWFWMGSELQSYKLQGLKDFILKVLPGETLPEAIRLRVLHQGGTIQTQEFQP
jgi:hypothetical protein